MKQIKYLFLLLFLSLSNTVLADQSFDRIYVFGDSLSDSGNLASVVGPFPQPPYYQNRVTNGPVAVEIMAERLGLPLQSSLHLIGPAIGTNYAVAAAKATRNDPIDLNTQVALFLANHGSIAPANALYVMFLGGNDVRQARDTTDWFAAVQVVNEAANNIGNQMQVLASLGAKNWLVVNAPDIGSIPETSLIAEASGFAGLPARASALTVMFNKMLKRKVQLLEEEAGIEAERFDLFKLFGRIIEKGNKLGFSNTTDACFSSELYEFYPGCNFGDNFSQYIFFDEIHPTARVHALVGEAMYRKVKEDEPEKDHKHKNEVESAHDD